MSEEEIVNGFRSWSKDKAYRYQWVAIVEAIMKLYLLGIIEQTLTGYTISR